MFYKQDESEIDEDEIKNLAPILGDLNDVTGATSGELSSIYYSAHQSGANMTMDATGNLTGNPAHNLSSISANSNSSYWNFHHNHHGSFNYRSQPTKKRIKAPESLKSPLTPWRGDPAEPNWKAYIDDPNSIGLADNSPSKLPSRRHTMTFADLNRLSSTLSSLNIFSSASKKQQQTSPIKTIKETDESSPPNSNEVSNSSSKGVFKWDKWDWAIVKSRLFPDSSLRMPSSSKVNNNNNNDDDNNHPVYLKHGPGYGDFGFVSDSELVKVRRTKQETTASTSLTRVVLSCIVSVFC